MSWGKDHIDRQALASAPEDYAAFEAIGLAFKEGARVLDVGCYDGLNTVLKFAPYAGIARVVGIDPVVEAIEQARERVDDGRFEFLVSDFSSFDPGAERFDVVYFSHVFQHLEDPQAAMDKAAALLAPGGFVIVKTTDDGAKLSYPDPNRAMERLFALYDGFVRPNTEHTRFTDRYNGRKCLAYLNHAGLVDVRVRTFTIDTTGKTLDERRALFERCVYFRRNVPACVDPATADEVHRLVDEWGALFDREDYYYCNVTFVALARKPIEGGGSFEYAGSVFGDAASYGAESSEGEGFRIRRMREDDIGAVMGIQMASFDDPWTPFAFALELRHNPRARYMVATDGCGNVVGYVGWWEMDEYATISQIATAPSARRQGIAHSLLSRVLASSAAAGCGSVQLEVRSRNDGARSFYRAEGFVQADVRPGYYQAPEDDAVILVRECRA